MPTALAPIYRIDELRALERKHAAQPLMERAGAALAAAAAQMATDHGRPIVVLAGPGNNGGDGFVAARLLRQQFHAVTVVFHDDAGRLPKAAAAAHAALLAQGGTTLTEPPPGMPGLVIDALFGIGITRPLAPRHAQLVAWANRCGAPLLACDIPTGLNADTGIATAPAIRADATLTFLGLKPGLLTAGGPDLCGVIHCDALGIDALMNDARGTQLRWTAVAAMLPDTLRRVARNVHKGTFGTLAVIGGAEGMLGAPLLAARAALRLGAGKVQVGFAAASFLPVDMTCPELMLRDAAAAFDGATAIVIGPGLGTGTQARALLAQALVANVPITCDADALNLLATDSGARSAMSSRTAATLVTPHPAEAARLLHIDTAAITHDRLTSALTLAQRLRAHVVVKGAGSVLAHPDGRWDINSTGSAALASAGTGDVLSGMAGALLAQRVDPAWALRIAVCLHGAAADALVARGLGPLGLPASALADEARDLVNRASAARRAT